ncbi:MAG: hypothetical protein EBT69_08895, partial [Verrucomicrobia bacterium]|nr:hypothetical protein [Verrucomicrobiota bacterium]
GADSGTGSFGGVISGTGTVTKTGVGNETFTAANTFTGVFTQNGGVTILANASGPALFNGQGGDIVIGNSGSSGTYSTLRMGAANQLGSNVNVTFGSNATSSSCAYPELPIAWLLGEFDPDGQSNHQWEL